jgi:hypothetical protein
MAVIKQFWQHVRTGEVYAVELDGAKVTGACGPLEPIEQAPGMLETMPFDPDLGRQLNATQEAYTLARPPQVQRVSIGWGWKSLQRWLIENRPEIGLGTMEGIRGYYRRDIGLQASFVPCGYTWRDVAQRLGAARSSDE